MQGQMPSDSTCIASSSTLGIKRTNHRQNLMDSTSMINLDFSHLPKYLALQAEFPHPCNPLDSPTCLLSLPLPLDTVRHHKLPPQCLNQLFLSLLLSALRALCALIPARRLGGLARRLARRRPCRRLILLSFLFRRCRCRCFFCRSLCRLEPGELFSSPLRCLLRRQTSNFLQHSNKRSEYIATNGWQTFRVNCNERVEGRTMR